MNPPGAARVIVAVELRAVRNRLLKSGSVRLVLLAIFLLIGTVVLGGSAVAVGAAVGHFIPSALDALLAAGFTALSVVMLVIGFPTVISSFFVGRDLLQLVVAPVRVRDIFVARLLLAMSANFIISAVLLAGLIGLGVGAGAPFAYFAFAIPLVFAQVLAVTAAQAILMTVILRWVPARLARDVAAGLAAFTGAGFYLAWNLSLQRGFRAGSRPSLAGVSGLTSLAGRFDWLPTTWPGHALNATVTGSALPAAGWLLATLALGAILLVVAERFYERTLLAGLGIFGSTPVVWRRKPARSRSPAASGGPASPTLAIARKDWLGFRRDIRRLSRLLPALLFPIGYAFALSRPSQSIGGFWTNVFLVSFMSMFMSSMLAPASIPSEHRGFQLLRMAPVTMWQVLRAKVLLTLPPVLALTLAFGVLVAALSHSQLSEFLALLALVLWMACGFVSIGVSAGGIDPRFDSTDDRRAIGLLGSIAAIAGSLGFALLSVGAFALFYFGAQAAAGANLGPIPSTPTIGALMWAFGLVAGAGAATIVGVLLWVANQRLSAFEAPIAATT